jgi:hypothetical protein
VTTGTTTDRWTDEQVGTPYWARSASACPWVKVMQLFGVQRCYLPSGHDGAHRSIDWFEWS